MISIRRIAMSLSGTPRTCRDARSDLGDPVKLSESPAFAGGRIDRGAPCYGEDNEYVYGELLGMTKREIADLAAEGVF
jgi:crotonobetainyl-CoA:carnitine CoA-transferase CaiB-like acyl-CoA transferase